MPKLRHGRDSKLAPGPGKPLAPKRRHSAVRERVARKSLEETIRRVDAQTAKCVRKRSRVYRMTKGACVASARKGVRSTRMARRVSTNGTSEVELLRASCPETWTGLSRRRQWMKITCRLRATSSLASRRPMGGSMDCISPGAKGRPDVRREGRAWLFATSHQDCVRLWCGGGFSFSINTESARGNPVTDPDKAGLSPLAGTP